MFYKTIKERHHTEEIIKKSRFICHLNRVSSEEEARAIISQIKKEHHKASHSCSAMIIGEKHSLKRSSDDGEPSGTAGIPMLNVLEKKELTNILAVVTRYFGGVKLGTGGLIRAYSSSVATALSQAELVQVKTQAGLQLTLSYAQYQTYANFLSAENLDEHNSQFQAKITTELYVDPERLADISQKLAAFYQGKVDYCSIGTRIVEQRLDNSKG